MSYGEIVEKAKKALEEKGILVTFTERGAGTKYCFRTNEEYFKLFGFKFRMIDTQMADTSLELFGQGTDVLKAIALGANGVLMGYMMVMGLAANGREGVRDIVLAMTEQLRRTLTITGCKNLSEVDESILVKRDFIL